MLYTLADARDAVKKYVDAGSCTTASIDARIHEALERIMDSGEWECLRRFVRIAVCNRCFPLPFNVEKILWADVDGTPAKVFGTPYQFLSSGPGDLDHRCCGSGYKDIVDKGDDWPVMYDIPHTFEFEGETITPEGMHLIAFSPEQADADTATLRAYGWDINSREINTDTEPGQLIPIHRWRGGNIGRITGTIDGTWSNDLETSASKFKEVGRVIKSATLGPITLYAVDKTTSVFYFLGEYHPTVTIPQFRRYNVTNKNIGCRADVLALVKMRLVKMTRADDILPIDSLQALKLMCMAIRQENASDLQGAIAYEQDARRVLGEREKSRTMADGTPTILNRCYRTSLGRKMNRGRIL